MAVSLSYLQRKVHRKAELLNTSARCFSTASLSASRSNWTVKAPAPTVGNGTISPTSQTGRQATEKEKEKLRYLPWFLSNFNARLYVLNGICLGDGATYLLLLQDPLFLPAETRKKQRPRLLRAPPPIPSHRPDKHGPRSTASRDPNLSCPGTVGAKEDPRVEQDGSPLRGSIISPHFAP